MTTSAIATYLKFANLQMAAEAFLTDQAGALLKDELLANALIAGNHHTSRFPEVVAQEFLNDYEIVAQQPNTSTGFSGSPGGVSSRRWLTRP